MRFIEKVKEISKVVIDKGVEVGKAAKKQIDIVTMESQISDCKKKIGDIVYKEKVDTNNEEINKTVEKINELMKDIERLKRFENL